MTKNKHTSKKKCVKKYYEDSKYNCHRLLHDHCWRAFLAGWAGDWSIKNGCYLIRLVLSVTEKPGWCPSPQDAGSGTMECFQDVDCYGSRKCCKEGAGYRCQEPSFSEFIVFWAYVDLQKKIDFNCVTCTSDGVFHSVGCGVEGNHWIQEHKGWVHRMHVNAFMCVCPGVFVWFFFFKVFPESKVELHGMTCYVISLFTFCLA